ncbi:MAG: hypothetical protein HYY17_00480 [Planctomycetes bacterium]|nr:hypothetical protein [Planctomycetota bacterium]
MDERSEASGRHPVVLTGLGAATSAPADPGPYLRDGKHRKFMGEQDCLALVAAGEALREAGLLGRPLGERAGLFLAVGFVSFERDDMERLVAGSTEEGRFSMRRFSTAGFNAIHPLRTFRCLSNMPAFHISVNFDIRGPYFVTYPGIGQWYLALDEAVRSLDAGAIDVALVAGVAYQRNFLVERHFRRLVPPLRPEELVDAAGCIVLERDAARARGRLLALGIDYAPYHPFEEAPVPDERFTVAAPGEMGAASVAATLARSRGRIVEHSVACRDGIRASSRWEIA